EFVRWYAEEAVRSEGSYGESPAGGTRTIVTHKPLGVAALVTPWNFPAAMAARKLAPALAAGCTTVLKPASETPLTALAIADILEEAGAIAGTVNVVPSRRSAEIAETLLSTPPDKKLLHSPHRGRVHPPGPGSPPDREHLNGTGRKRTLHRHRRRRH